MVITMTDGQSEQEVGRMAARTKDELQAGATIIPFDRGLRRREPAPEVVAVVLADGTIRRLGERPDGDGDRSFTVGQLSGDGWILWWQRRGFDE
jgi:hypothetical protein